MIYTAGGNDSFADVAMRYTIGGSAYGPAIANLNGEGGKTVMSAYKAYEIPEEWLKESFKGYLQESGDTPGDITVTGGNRIPQEGFMGLTYSSWLMVGLAGVAIYMLTGNK